MKEYECMTQEQIDEEFENVTRILDEEKLQHKVAIFKVLGDLNRVKIVELLSHYPQLCVNEIAQFINASVATTSHHLITLRNHEIIKSEKEGKRVIYRLDASYVKHVFEMVDNLQKQCPNAKQ